LSGEYPGDAVVTLADYLFAGGLFVLLFSAIAILLP
jgi:hypothetical protein